MREGKRKPTDRVMEEADDDRLEREDQETWDGLYHLSVFAAPLYDEETPEEAVQRFFGTHRKVKFFRIAPLGKLEAAGFELHASWPDPYHYDVVLGHELTPEVVETFESCFEPEPRRNPAWRS